MAELRASDRIAPWLEMELARQLSRVAAPESLWDRIQERPVAVDGQVVIRPMMYVALSYDHRLVDGEQAVTFLVRVKERLEEPARMLFEI